MSPIQMGKKTGGAAKPGTPSRARAGADGDAPVSIRPSDQQQGGLIDDVDVTFKEMSFVIWDYDGKADKPALAVCGLLVSEDGEEHTQYWSAGDAARFQPSEDGKTCVRVGGGGGGLTNSTNAAALFKSIVDIGFPEDKLTPSLACIEGLVAHVNRVAQPKRSGLPQQEGERERTTLVCSKLIRLPWETATAKGQKSSASRATAPAPAASAEGDVSDEAVEVLAGILAKKSPVKMSALPVLAIKPLAGNANRAEIIKLLKDPEFLAAASEQTGAFTFDPDAEEVAAA